MDLNALISKVKESGMSMTYVAKRLEISRASLYKKLHGDVEFKISEIATLSNVLHMSSEDRDSIFFS